jgi:3-deoxy-D-manno-octulosonic-acid transferase
MYFLYKFLTTLAAPVVPSLLQRRLARGKEDENRFSERLGKASIPRPAGKLLWIHAASVGEANAALPLVDVLLAQAQPPQILLTTGTVTSARLMQERLPKPAIHQFVPVDTPQAVESFLSYWQPDAGLWVDSEFWPNLIMKAKARGVVMGVINARMSERTYLAWWLCQPLIRQLLSCFSFCFAQSEADMERLSIHGMRTVKHVGNLKYDAAPLPFSERDILLLKSDIGARPLWLAASTHPGEEAIIARVHTALKQSIPNLLTVIIPRHAERGDAIAGELSPRMIARRSKQQVITPATEIYLADTMGELGLFYRLCPIAFIGGSLVEHGGQNPLEPARLGAAIILGPHTQNFIDICKGLELAHGCIRVQDENALRDAVKNLLSEPKHAQELAERAFAHVQGQAGQVTRIMNELQPYLALR